MQQIQSTVGYGYMLRMQWPLPDLEITAITFENMMCTNVIKFPGA